jgi:hypothetical protein
MLIPWNYSHAWRIFLGIGSSKFEGIFIENITNKRAIFLF